MPETEIIRDILKLDGDPFDGKPFGWIQWKGTRVCIDLHCSCGALLHWDGDFFYAFKCPHCNRHYEIGSHIAIHELTEAEVTAYKLKDWPRFDEPAPEQAMNLRP